MFFAYIEQIVISKLILSDITKQPKKIIINYVLNI